VEARVYKLKKLLDKPNRIVIDLQFPEVEEKERPQPAGGQEAPEGTDRRDRRGSRR